MSKISFWKVLGIVGTISSELTAAMEDENTPGKIDAVEAVQITHKLIRALDMDLGENEVYLNIAIRALEEIPNMMKDNVISAREILDFSEKICNELGIDLDKEGIKL